MVVLLRGFESVFQENGEHLPSLECWDCSLIELWIPSLNTKRLMFWGFPHICSLPCIGKQDDTLAWRMNGTLVVLGTPAQLYHFHVAITEQPPQLVWVCLSQGY